MRRSAIDPNGFQELFGFYFLSALLSAYLSFFFKSRTDGMTIAIPASGHYIAVKSMVLARFSARIVPLSCQ